MSDNDIPQRDSGGPGADAGTPDDQGYDNAIRRNPIDGTSTRDEFSLENERETQRRIGGLTEKVSRLEADINDVSAELKNWPTKLWRQVVSVGLMLLGALGAFFLMQSSVRDSLQSAITSNTETAVANEAKIQAIDEKFNKLNIRMDNDLVGLGGEMLDLRNAINEHSKEIAVLNERAK